MSYLAGNFADTGFILFLTDADGKLLCTAGDLDLRRQFSRNDFEPGIDISEAVYGTNAVGTAIADRRPMQLLASEHFCAGPTKFSCTAAPIYIPGQAELARRDQRHGILQACAHAIAWSDDAFGA